MKKHLVELLHEIGYHYLVASCDKANIESHKVAQRIGMNEKSRQKIVNDKHLLFYIDKKIYVS
ncbi:hypothetical protein DSM107007_54790 [Nostoc sp. PCC 7120 = FACHB-418]|uniref:N-acetyltransferase domain-containing protein n=1 Tax=Trichormus variabilis NIES-23 TaxID=1973479 RepID=A0A1Z4KVB6_ANAVA|nr:hypothetical protein [Anabaena cylindrica]RUR73120.1 hypothetical protein DSM107007_54790 [Nostoc sp. PCC 7120 = FACHB-418]BAY72868.1 hypothetical protein NIES23_56960 [Trichormus variabilis NIES-23]